MTFIQSALHPLPTPSEISRVVAAFDRFINTSGLNLEVDILKTLRQEVGVSGPTYLYTVCARSSVTVQHWPPVAGASR